METGRLFFRRRMKQLPLCERRMFWVTWQNASERIHSCCVSQLSFTLLLGRRSLAFVVSTT